jgi:hypothetical protein
MGQLADAVELAYERGARPDWELVFELTRRAMSPEASEDEPSPVRLSPRT